MFRVEREGEKFYSSGSWPGRPLSLNMLDEITSHPASLSKALACYIHINVSSNMQRASANQSRPNPPFSHDADRYDRSESCNHGVLSP